MVLPWVPATAIDRFPAVRAASAWARAHTGMSRRRASASSTFRSPIALETTTASGSRSRTWRRIVPDVDVGAQIPQLREPFRVLEVGPAHDDATSEQQFREVPHAGTADPDQVEARRRRRATARRASGCFPAAACRQARSSGAPSCADGLRHQGREPLAASGFAHPVARAPIDASRSGSSTRSSTVVAKTSGVSSASGTSTDGADAHHLLRVRVLMVLGRMGIRHQDRRQAADRELRDRRRARARHDQIGGGVPQLHPIEERHDHARARRPRAPPRPRAPTRVPDRSRSAVGGRRDRRTTAGRRPRPGPGAARPGSRRSP